MNTNNWKAIIIKIDNIPIVYDLNEENKLVHKFKRRRNRKILKSKHNKNGISDEDADSSNIQQKNENYLICPKQDLFPNSSIIINFDAYKPKLLISDSMVIEKKLDLPPFPSFNDNNIFDINDDINEILDDDI